MAENPKISQIKLPNSEVIYDIEGIVPEAYVENTKLVLNSEYEPTIIEGEEGGECDCVWKNIEESEIQEENQETVSAGFLTKAVYDANANGIVDEAEKLSHSFKISSIQDTNINDTTGEITSETIEKVFDGREDISVSLGSGLYFNENGELDVSCLDKIEKLDNEVEKLSRTIQDTFGVDDSGNEDNTQGKIDLTNPEGTGIAVDSEKVSFVTPTGTIASFSDFEIELYDYKVVRAPIAYNGGIAFVLNNDTSVSTLSI